MKRYLIMAIGSMTIVTIMNIIATIVGGLNLITFIKLSVMSLLIVAFLYMTLISLVTFIKEEIK